MWDPELTSPTAGTEGGSTSCFHFWSKTFWSVTKDQHPHASLFRTPGSRVGTNASPHPPPRRRTNPDHRNSRGTSLVLNALLFPFFTLKILPTFQSAYQGILFLEAVLVLFSDNLQHFSCYFFYDIFTLPLILWLFAFASYLPC